MYIPSLLTNTARRGSRRSRENGRQNPHLTLTIPSLSSLLRRPRPPGLPPGLSNTDQASNNPTVVREYTGDVPVNPARNPDQRSDEEFALQLASEQGIFDPDRLAKLRRRHWHVYSEPQEERVIPIVINRSCESLDTEDSDTTDYSASADTATTYEFDGSSPYSTPATANTTTPSTTSQLDFDIPAWELDVTNADPDFGHGLPTWVLAPDSNLPGLESLVYGYGIDDVEADEEPEDDEMDYTEASLPIDRSLLPTVVLSPTATLPLNPLRTTYSPIKHSPTSPNATAPSTTTTNASPTLITDAAPTEDLNAEQRPLTHARSRASSTASRSSVKDVPKAENWPF